MIRIRDVTELKAIVICNQRAYEIPKDVADEIAELGAALKDCASLIEDNYEGMGYATLPEVVRAAQVALKKAGVS